MEYSIIIYILPELIAFNSLSVQESSNNGDIKNCENLFTTYFYPYLMYFKIY